jgi:hypothetical protein
MKQVNRTIRGGVPTTVLPQARIPAHGMINHFSMGRVAVFSFLQNLNFNDCACLLAHISYA